MEFSYFKMKFLSKNLGGNILQAKMAILSKYLPILAVHKGFDLLHVFKSLSQTGVIMRQLDTPVILPFISQLVHNPREEENTITPAQRGQSMKLFSVLVMSLW